MSQYILTEEQFAFMKKHHAEIEYSIVHCSSDGHDFIATLEASEEYKVLFGDMFWDDAYDRYEDIPRYDRSLKAELRVSLAASSPKNGQVATDDLFSVDDLIRLRDEARKTVK